MNLLKELKVFFSYPRNMRVLLVANFIYAFVLPVLYFFISMYIMRNTSDVRLVMSFQMANYTGLLITFFFNGYLLRIVHVKYLYSLGMLISGASMAVMISLKQLDIYGITIAGSLMGVSFGLFWANRDYLALSSTTDENRNYYYGLESFLSTICSLVVPILVGWFIAGSQLYGWFGGDRNHAYFFVTIAVIFLALLASITVCQGTFTNPEPTNFLYWRYHPVWYKLFFMEILRGIGQGFMMTAPAMLIMKLIGGQEGILGVIQTVGGIFTAVTFYCIARVARPEHRLWVLGTGLVLFLTGTLFNAFLFSATGVIVLVGCQVVAAPLIECALFPIVMLVIDVLSKKEKRNKFGYLFNHEFGLYVGRISGGMLFIGVATYVSDTAALRYVLAIIGVLEFFSYFLCKQIVATCKELDAELTEHDLEAMPHSICEMDPLEDATK